MVDSILALQNIYFKIILISSFPITELRFSIPYFILFEDISWDVAFVFSIIGNISIGIIIIYVIGPIMYYLKKYSYFAKPINYILRRTRTRSSVINNFKLLGLIIFVGIPLPFTGVWTGSLAAYMFSISKKKAVFGIVIGVLISGMIVTALTLLGNEIWLQFLENDLNKKLGIVK